MPNKAVIRVSPALVDAARADADVVLRSLNSSIEGLNLAEASRRLQQFGPNSFDQTSSYPKLILLGKAILNPLVVLLAILAILSFATGDPRAGGVMAVMIFLGVGLRFVQEARADAAEARLKAMIHVTATVIRSATRFEIPLADLVPGDIVQLAAGDMIPGDLRILSCKDLHVAQSSLTGESYPVEKLEMPHVGSGVPESPLELRNICFLGTSVESGTGVGVIVATGKTSYLGSMASAMMNAESESAFEKGVGKFTWLMVRFMMAMVSVVFLINGLTKNDWTEAFFFALAIAVGLTPEMLPMIVTVCLSKGALAMSRTHVIVKQLSSIQDFGAMDILCTDKTGTLTMDKIVLERYCDVALEQDDGVLALAYLNSHFQTGLKNLLDRAVLDHTDLHHEIAIPQHAKIDEIPFDFTRKLMSVVVRTPEGKIRLICKGAPEEVFRRCVSFELQNETSPMDPVILEDLREEYQDLGSDGFRVLAIAYRDLEPKSAYSKEDEINLILRGYLAFFDPPKDTARAAIQALEQHGVSVRVLTGDNEWVTKKICREVGISTPRVLLGHQIESLSDVELESVVEATTVFARLSPGHKQRIIRAFQARHHTVGFLGDGINDSPALRAADVGISVDTAVDIAKESANVILLRKNLLVLDEGVLEGRKVFANILKYVRMGASSSFGNMFSVVGASLFLPYVPMAPIQLLTNSLLYDFSQVPIPTDEVDPEQIAKPTPWSIDRIARFILFIGPCSSVFDYTTFFTMLVLFDCWGTSDEQRKLFQTGWFVESLLTQTLIIHIIRTNRLPLVQSLASWQLSLTTLAVMATGIILPYTPLAPALDLVPLPWEYWPFLVGTLILYVGLTQLVKMWVVRRAES